MDKEDRKKVIIAIVVIAALAGGYWGGSKLSHPVEDKEVQAVEEKATEKEPAEKEQEAPKAQEKPSSPQDEVSYKQYVNGRFHYSVDYPEGFIKTMVPANNDGVEMRNPNDYAVLVASGSYVFESIGKEYQRALNDVKGNLGYHEQGSNWYVITWIQNGSLYYMKTIYKDKTRASFRLKYPAEMKDKYNPIIEHMEATLRID